MTRPTCRHGIDRSLWVLKKRKDGRKFYECSACGGFVGYIGIERTQPEAKKAKAKTT